MFKLGKLKAEFSDQDLMFRNLMRAVAIPESYDWDVLNANVVPFPMFDNDRLGCCVMSGRAHQTLRFEYQEQRRLITITDSEVEKEYFKETGGYDSGLVVSQSLKKWRTTGWTAAGNNYKIKAYSRLDLYNRSQIKAGMYSDLGVGIGFDVPQSAITQFNAGEPWTVVNNDGGSVGGHYVYCVAYDSTGITCVTWGQRQFMSWEFWDKYTDEAWAIIDAKDTRHNHGIINFDVIDEFLSKLKQ
jgi:YD repeat-containing protein